MIDDAIFDQDLQTITDDWDDILILNGVEFPCLLDSRELSRTLDSTGYGNRVSDKNTCFIRSVLIQGQAIKAEVTEVEARPYGKSPGTPYRIQGVNRSPDGSLTTLDLVDPRN